MAFDLQFYQVKINQKYQLQVKHILSLFFSQTINQIIDINKINKTDKIIFHQWKIMTECKYVKSLQMSKDIILRKISQLGEITKSNQEKQFTQTLINVLFSISTFNSDFIQNSLSTYAHNPLIKEKIQQIITKITETQNTINYSPKKRQQQQQAPKAILRTSSEKPRSKSADKQPKISSSKKDSSSGGLFGVFGKILGSKKQEKPKVYKMILPQKQSKAVYDPVKKKWIFEGEEEEPQKQIPKPPPKKQAQIGGTAKVQGSKDVKKMSTEMDELTAPPTFKRRGQTKSVGHHVKKAAMMIKQQIIPTTLVLQQNSIFDSLLNTIDKQFYKLNAQFIQFESQSQMLKVNKWNQMKVIEEKQLRYSGAVMGSSRLRREKQEKSLLLGLEEREKQLVDQMNCEIHELTIVSNNMLQSYFNIMQEQKILNQSTTEYDSQLNLKLMKIARDNTVISHQLGNEYQLKMYKLQQLTQQLKQIESEYPQIHELLENNSKRQEQQKLLTLDNRQSVPIQMMIFNKSPLSEQIQQTVGEIGGLTFDVNLLKQSLLEKERQIIALKFRLSQYEESIDEKGRVVMKLSGKDGLVNELADTLKALEVNAQRLQHGLEKQEMQAGEFSQQLSLLQRQLHQRDQQIQELNQFVLQLKKQLNLNNQKKNSVNQEQFTNNIIQCKHEQQHVDLQEEIRLRDIKIQSLAKQMQRQEIQISTLTQQLETQKQQSKSSFQPQLNVLLAQIQSLKLNNAQLQKDNQRFKQQLTTLQSQRRSLELIIRQQQILEEQRAKDNLQKLQAFAHSFAEENSLLLSIQAKQLQLSTHHRYSQSSYQRQNNDNNSSLSQNNSSRKSQLSNNDYNSDEFQSQSQKNSSFLSITDILTQMTHQYLQKLAQFKYQTNSLEQNNKNLNKTISKQRLRLNAEIQCLKKSLNTAQLLNEGYKKSRKQLQQKIISYETECERLKKKIQLMKKQQVTNRELLQQALYDKHNHSHSLSMLQNSNQELEWKVQSLQQEMSIKSNLLDEAMGDIERLKIQIQQKEDAIRQRDMMISKLRSVISEQSQQYALQIQTKQSQIKSITRQKQRELEHVKKQIQTIHEKNDRLEKENKTIKESSSSRQQEHQSIRKDLINKLKAKQIQLTQFRENADKKHKQLEKLIYNNKDLAIKCQQLQGLLIRIESSTKEQLQQMECKHKLQIDELTQQLNGLKEQNADQIMLIEDINSAKLNLQQHVANLEHQLNQTYKQNAHLQQTIQTNQSHNHHLSATYQQSLSQINNQKQQLQHSLELVLSRYNEIQSDFIGIKQNMDLKINYLTGQLESNITTTRGMAEQLLRYSQLVNTMDVKIQQLNVELQLNKERQSVDAGKQHEEEIAQVLQLLDSKQKQLSSLNITYRTLQQQYQQLNQNYNQLVETHNTSHHNNLRSTKKQQQLEQHNIQLLSIVQTIQQQNQSLKAQLNQNAQLVLHLEKDVKIKSVLLQQLGLELEQLKKKITDLSEQNTSLHEEIERVNKNNQQLQQSQYEMIPKNKFQTLLNQYQQLSAQLEQSKLEKGQIQHQNQLLQKDYYKMQQEKQTLQQQNYQLREENTRLLKTSSLEQPISQTNRNGIEQQNVQLNQLMTQLSSRLQAMEKQNSELIQRGKITTEQLLRYQQINTQLNKKCEELRIKIEKVTEEKDGVITKMIQDMDGKDVQIKQLTEQLQSMKLQQHDQLQLHADNSNRQQQLKELLGVLSQEIEQKRIKQLQLQQIISQQLIQINMLKQKLFEIQQSHNSQKDTQLQNHQLYTEILQQKQQSLIKQISDLKAKCQQLGVFNQQLEQNNNRLYLSNEQNEGRVKQLQKQKQQLLMRNEEIESDNCQLLSNYEQLQSQTNNLRQQLHSSRQQIRSLTQQLEAYQSHGQSNQQQIQGQRERIIELQKQVQELHTLLRNMEEEIGYKDEQLLAKANQIHLIKQRQLETANLFKQSQQQQSHNNDIIFHSSNDDDFLYKQQLSVLSQQIQSLKSQLSRKDRQIEQMSEIIASQAGDIQHLKASNDKEKELHAIVVDRLKVVDEQLTVFKSKYQQQSDYISQLLKQQSQKSPKSQQQQLTNIKLQLQQVYAQLRNKKIEADQLRSNLFQVNKIFTEREAKYEAKIKSLETQIHKYKKTKDIINKYEGNIKQLQYEIQSLTEEKTSFLRAIENLQKQIINQQKSIKSNDNNNEVKSTNTNDIKTRVTKSEILQPAAEIKPTGFFGSISSLFMSPTETQRIAKKITQK